MEFQFRLFSLIAIALLLRIVTSSTITVTPYLILTSGQTLAIRCQETVTGTDNTLLRLDLYREVRYTSTSTYELVVGYAFVISTLTYKQTWGTNTGDLQGRVNLTETFTDTSYLSGSFDFVLPDVRCEDADAFVCRSSHSGGALPDSTVQNISVVGISQLTSLTGAQECDSFQADTDTCNNCFNFDDPSNGPKPKYAPINQELTLICTATLDSSTTTVLRWYKKTANDDYQQPMNENITDNSNLPTPGICTHTGRSTLRYFPNSNDQELRIFCEASSQQSMNISICVQGLTVSPPGTSPGTLNPGLTVSPPGTLNPGGENSDVNIGAAVGGGIAAVVVVSIVIIVAIFLFRKQSMKSAEATRPPEEQVTAHFQNGLQNVDVYQDLSITRDYMNNIDNQPYATLDGKGWEASGNEQRQVPVDESNHVETQFATYSPQYEEPPEYVEICAEDNDYENKKTSSTYYNL